VLLVIPLCGLQAFRDEIDISLGRTDADGDFF
jgi:hypothetical protein